MKPNTSVKSWAKTSICLLMGFLIILLAGRFVFSQFFELYSMPNTASMLPTLNEGDLVLTNRNKDDIHPGDLVAFLAPDDQQMFILRVIGVPGDKLKSEGDALYINDKKIPRKQIADKSGTLFEEAISGRNYKIKLSKGVQSIYQPISMTIQEGHYFVLGDNRHFANDSRLLGAISLNRIQGKVLGVYTTSNDWISREKL